MLPRAVLSRGPQGNSGLARINTLPAIEPPSSMEGGSCCLREVIYCKGVTGTRDIIFASNGDNSAADTAW